MYNKNMEYTFKNNRIAELRKSFNLSQRKLAEKIGTSQANLSRWEQGLNEPSIIECWKIANFFDVSIDYLCGRKDY
ncbi:MAG: helix-turn-helix transcriptional regulator [Clostridia bacterium]|nr:helix-turn-helix transcriptional regulator [Clostridia bacterium]